MLKDAGDKIPIVDKNAIESAMAELKKAIEGNDTPGMSKAMDALMQAQHKASEALYKNAQNSGGSGASDASGASGAESTPPPGESGSQGGDVIDAEVVEDKKD
jgi:molecular chaperone DnaK